MLRVPGIDRRFCDGIRRRDFLQIGTLSIGGLTLPDLLRAESLAGPAGSTQKSVIMVYLSGGPPQLDTFDLKPQAPREIRGDFAPISTNVPGVQICELLPRTSQVMDKLAIVRSVTGMPPEHAAFHLHTGKRNNLGGPPGGWPSLGSVVSKLQGPVHDTVPPFVSLMRPMEHKPYGDPGPAGFLGALHGPFLPTGEMMSDMTLTGITTKRLSDRKQLLQSLDAYRRRVEARQTSETPVFTEQALATLTSSRLADALDVSQEDRHTRALYGIQYGTMAPKLVPESNDERDAPGTLQDFLVARRLIEAGVRCVTLTLGQWDLHSHNFIGCRQLVPVLDRAIYALVTDLHQRGLDKDVLVVFWGEFGRTPQINTAAGRDHWMSTMSVLFAGGGVCHGQVIGATDRYAAEVKEHPIAYTRVLSTLYHHLGINPHHATVTDPSGRPRYLVDEPDPIVELT